MSYSAVAIQAEPALPERRPDRLYFPALDGLRFVAFGLVYVFHRGIPQGTLSSLVGHSAARALLDHGWVGVQVFFVLSGYLITTLLLGEEAEFGRVDLRAFWIRRVLRIWPVYYLVVIVGFLVIPAFDVSFDAARRRAMAADHLPAFLFFLGNWTMSFVSTIPSDVLRVLWSVCIEEQFYLFVPLLVACVGRRYRIGLVAALMAAAVLARWLVARSITSEVAIRFSTFLCFDTLLSGVLLALVVGPIPTASPGRNRAVWLQWPLLLATVWLFTREQLAIGTVERRTWDFVWVWVWGVALVAAVIGSRGWLRAVLGYSRLVWLGKISYGLYMYHEIALWLKRYLDDRVPWFVNKDVLLTIAAFATTVGMAALSYYVYERPFLALKRKWTRVASRPI